VVTIEQIERIQGIGPPTESRVKLTSKVDEAPISDRRPLRSAHRFEQVSAVGGGQDQELARRLTPARVIVGPGPGQATVADYRIDDRFPDAADAVLVFDVLASSPPTGVGQAWGSVEIPGNGKRTLSLSTTAKVGARHRIRQLTVRQLDGTATAPARIPVGAYDPASDDTSLRARPDFLRRFGGAASYPISPAPTPKPSFFEEIGCSLGRGGAVCGPPSVGTNLDGRIRLETSSMVSVRDGRLVEASGQGSLQAVGVLPPVAGVPAVSGHRLTTSYEWRYSKTLQEPWPKDRRSLVGVVLITGILVATAAAAAFVASRSWMQRTPRRIP